MRAVSYLYVSPKLTAWGVGAEANHDSCLLCHSRSKLGIETFAEIALKRHSRLRIGWPILSDQLNGPNRPKCDKPQSRIGAATSPSGFFSNTPFFQRAQQLQALGTNHQNVPAHRAGLAVWATKLGRHALANSPTLPFSSIDKKPRVPCDLDGPDLPPKNLQVNRAWTADKALPIAPGRASKSWPPDRIEFYIGVSSPAPQEPNTVAAADLPPARAVTLVIHPRAFLAVGDERAVGHRKTDAVNYQRWVPFCGSAHIIERFEPTPLFATPCDDLDHCLFFLDGEKVGSDELLPQRDDLCQLRIGQVEVVGGKDAIPSGIKRLSDERCPTRPDGRSFE